MNSLHIERFSAPLINRNEIMRYCGGSFPEWDQLTKQLLSELSNELCYSVCYRLVDVIHQKDGCLDLGFFKTDSSDLKRNLKKSEKAVIFAATVGLGVERAINKYSVLSPTCALIADAIGTERIEALADALCERLKAHYGNLCPRFSPGYGDLPLALQRDIFSALDCHKSIGLSLNESLMMSPQKSVTAIVGILPPENGLCRQTDAVDNKCQNCKNMSCAYRKMLEY